MWGMLDGLGIEQESGHKGMILVSGLLEGHVRWALHPHRLQSCL